MSNPPIVSIGSLPALVLGLAVFLLGGPHVGAAEEHSKPNIIFILVDDMGWSDLGSYGSEIQTPNLDQLGEGGLRMTQMHNTGKCYPSRACLLTGSYYQQVDNTPFRNCMTLAEVLKSAGYRSFASGKHHGSDNLYDRGFDHYYGMRSGEGNHFNPGDQRPGEPTPATKKSRTFCFDERVVEGWTPEDPAYYSTDTFTDWSIQFLDEAETQDDQQPWFLYLSYTAPHAPIQAWPEDIAKYDGVYDVGYDAIAEARYQRMLDMGVINEEQFPRSDPTYRNWGSLNPEQQADQARRMQVYAAMMDRVDQNVGRLLDHLEALGELENTLIMYASDNGAFFHSGDFGDGEIGAMDRWAYLEDNWANVTNTPFRKGKNTSWQGGIATPMIAWWPEKIPAGLISHEPAHFIDIMPTLMDITGAEHQETWDGQPTWPLEGTSLLPVFQGQELNRYYPLYYSFRGSDAAIRYPWKILRTNGSQSPWKLFDLATDRTETQDVSADHPEVVERLSESYENWAERCRSSIPVGPPKGVYSNVAP